MPNIGSDRKVAPDFFSTKVVEVFSSGVAMTFSSFSPEGRLDSGLRGLNCTGTSFVGIARELGVKVSAGGFSEGMSGKRPFDPETLDRLLEVLERMNLLQAEIDVPIQWGATEKVTFALGVRLAAKIAKELHLESIELNEAANRSTETVRLGLNQAMSRHHRGL